MPRRYELKRRAELQDETRQRIVEAAVELHGSLGMTKTTMTQIAALAGVGRQTLYRYFPDETALGEACSGHYWASNPFPDLAPWRAVADADARLRLGLRESYAYHRQTEAMIRLALKDVGDSPLMQGYHDYWQKAAGVIAAAWPLRGRKRTLLRAALGHAVVFPTWHSLVRDQGLSDEQAVELMHRLTCSCDSG